MYDIFILQTLFTILMSTIKLTRKQTGATQTEFHERLLYLYCPYYKTTN